MSDTTNILDQRNPATEKAEYLKLKKHLDTAYELLHKLEQYQLSDVQRMTKELVDFKTERAERNYLVPSHIDAGIAAGLLHISKNVN